MNDNFNPNINVDIHVDKDQIQNNIPKNIFADINIDREIDKEEIIKIFYDTMKSNKDTLKLFFDNEREFVSLIKNFKHFITPEEFNKINKSFLEIKKLLFDTASVQNEKLGLINDWYKENKQNYILVAYVLFILIAIIGLKNSRSYY